MSWRGPQTAAVAVAVDVVAAFFAAAASASHVFVSVDADVPAHSCFERIQWLHCSPPPLPFPFLLEGHQSPCQRPALARTHKSSLPARVCTLALSFSPFRQS